MRAIPVILCWLVLSVHAQAHPSHTSFTEIDWNENGNALEISLKLIPEDLESALGLREGKSIAIQDTPRHRAIIAAWLAEVFIVSVDDKPQALQLVGLELDYDQTWIYFTISADQQQVLVLKNVVLHSYIQQRGQQQINQVQRLWAAPHERMTFTDSVPQRLWTPTGPDGSAR